MEETLQRKLDNILKEYSDEQSKKTYVGISIDGVIKGYLVYCVEDNLVLFENSKESLENFKQRLLAVYGGFEPSRFSRAKRNKQYKTYENIIEFLESFRR